MEPKMTCKRCNEEVEDTDSRCKCYPFFPLIRVDEEDDDG